MNPDAVLEKRMQWLSSGLFHLRAVSGGLQCMHVVTALFSQPCSRNVDTELERWVKLDLAGIAMCQNTPALCVWVENLT